MKTPLICLLLMATALCAQPEKLSEVDREALLDRLEKLKEGASSRADARFRSAISAYRAAMATDASAIAFYLKCVEKVDFEENEKSFVDFREWKRKNDEKNSDSAFKTALRHQLRWLILTLQAASEDPDYDYLSREAISCLDAIMSQADKIGGQKNTLSAGVTSTVFAKAYDIDNVKVDDWPKAPFPAKAIFEQIVFPPLRDSGKISELRNAWEKLIRYEGIVAEKWNVRKAPNNNGNRKNDDAQREAKKLADDAQKLQYAKFLKETLPELRWAAEVDLYKAGDERNAALRMISIIEKNPYHPSIEKWADELLDLLQLEFYVPDPDAPEEEAPEKTDPE